MKLPATAILYRSAQPLMVATVVPSIGSARASTFMENPVLKVSGNTARSVRPLTRRSSSPK